MAGDSGKIQPSLRCFRVCFCSIRKTEAFVVMNIEVKAAVAIETQVATPGVMVEAVTASTAKPRLINSVSAVVALR